MTMRKFSVGTVVPMHQEDGLLAMSGDHPLAIPNHLRPVCPQIMSIEYVIIPMMVLVPRVSLGLRLSARSHRQLSFSLFRPTSQ